MTLVSIVMPAYNAEDFIDKSIESILSQSLRDFEFIIINDGSTDKTADILNTYAASDVRIKIIHQENHGVTRSLNTGISMASSDYIARMDADDVSHPKRLEEEYDFLSTNQDCVLVGTDYSIIDTDDNAVKKVRRPNTDEDIRLQMCVYSPFAHGSVMFRKSAFEKAGKYRASGGSAEDYDLWARMMGIGNVFIIPKNLFFWRLGDTNITTIKSDLVAASAARIRGQINQNQSVLINPTTLYRKQSQYSKQRFQVLLDVYCRIAIYQIKQRSPLGIRNIKTLLSFGKDGRRIVLNRIVEVATGGRRSIVK